MATKTKMTAEDLLDQFKEMTLLELSDFVKKFEETFDVQAAAAAPMMMAAPGAAGAAAEEAEEQDRVRRGPHGRRRQEDPGDQGGAGPDEPRPQGGQGSRGRRPEAGPGEGRPRKRPTRPRSSSRAPAARSRSSRPNGRVGDHRQVSAAAPSPGSEGCIAVGFRTGIDSLSSNIFDGGESMTDERTFGQRLRATRIKAGYSQSDLEEISGIPKARLADTRTGTSHPRSRRSSGWRGPERLGGFAPG